MDKPTRDKYTVVIGLEVHAQLLTKSKIFNSDSAEYGSKPNTNVSVITLAHPGTLPRLNKQATEFAMKMGHACNSTISRFQIFDRKNYFYPDLPKGYQITQDRTPICIGGFITIKPKDAEECNIILNRIHIEEDAGKLIHLDNETDSLVDFNRAGVSLIEIVTEPCLRNSDEAYALLTEIRRLVRYLDICDGNMEEGSLRCDANISLMLKDAKEFGKKVEVKNMNSVRNVQRAIEHEVERQIVMLEKGELIISETRTFNATDGKTYGMRAKEELNDYRYFPDPDLSPLEVSDEWLGKIKSEMPALPREWHQKFVTEYHLPEYDATVLTDTKEMALYFDEACRFTKNFKGVSNWLMGPVKSYLNDQAIDADKFPVRPKALCALVDLVDEGKVSYATATQKILPELLLNPDKPPLSIAKELNLIQDSDENFILPIVESVIKEFPLKVEEYCNGKKGILAMFMGEVMKRSKGQANPKLTNELLLKKLIEIEKR